MEYKMYNIPNIFIEYLKKQYEEDILKSIINGYKNTRKLSLRINTIK